MMKRERMFHDQTLLCYSSVPIDVCISIVAVFANQFVPIENQGASRYATLTIVIICSVDAALNLYCANVFSRCASVSANDHVSDELNILAV